ncbi:MAG: CoA transferase [Pseudomonadota bacterium]
MFDAFSQQISKALGPELQPTAAVTVTGNAELPSCFAVSDLASATISAAAQELVALAHADTVAVDARLASLWFDMTLRPTTWELPSAWDAIAGVYEANDGWIRLHTNAPHHRDAALHVLGCAADKPAVAEAVAQWGKTELETAIVLAGGAAAAMHSMKDWAAHPQGKAILQEPLIHWREKDRDAPPATLQGLKVLDLTRVLAGPVASRFLAGFGADVLRIDPPWWNEPGVEPEVTVGKRRAGLDLTQAEDRARFEDLLREADVLVHGYRPGALEDLGFGPEALYRLAPHMIEVSLCAYGWTGPWADRRGFDSLVQMSCGIAAEGMRRAGRDGPVPLPVQALDHATGYLMAAAALRAVRQCNANGRIMAARLSLARTASLLTDVGPREFIGEDVIETRGDVEPVAELTDWGKAHRLRFPVELGGKPIRWQIPAGNLRVDRPYW